MEVRQPKTSPRRMLSFTSLSIFTFIISSSFLIRKAVCGDKPHARFGRGENSARGLPILTIGTCFFHSFNFQHRRADIAFNLSRKYWGQSYATETAREVILFGFNQWGLNRIQGTCMIKNIASARVMEKVGMTFEGILRKYTYGKGHFHDLKLYSILRDEI